MNWKHLTEGLVASGMTQVEIARSCGVAQSSVSDLLSGRTREPRYSTGSRLLALAKRRNLKTSSSAGAVECDALAAVNERASAAGRVAG